MLTGLWNLQDFENSRQNRSKNKLVRKKGRDTSVWKLLVPGYGLLGVSSFNSGGERRSTYLILACSRCSDSRAPEKNSQRNIKETLLFAPPSPPLHVLPVYTLTRSPITAALYYLNVQTYRLPYLALPTSFIDCESLSIVG